MAKVLLINPAISGSYDKSKMGSAIPYYFPLNLLTIASPLLGKHEAKLLDLNLAEDREKAVTDALKSFNPDYAGITFVTVNYSQAKAIASAVKKFNNKITVIGGGVHITSDYKNTLLDSEIDIAVIGEGDFKLLEIIETADKEKIKGIAYKKNGEVAANEREQPIKDLDTLPFPAVELININDYHMPYTLCRNNPVFPLETSRGCVYGCVYCNKSVFGRKFRVKTPDRVISDLKKIAGLGYKEVHMFDDNFTTDKERAKEICRRIIKENIKLTINCANGIRADSVDYELITLMKQAGVYRISLGVESGSQKVLDRINKSIKKESVEEIVKMCKKAGIETLAYFMFGLPDETEEDMKETIKFAKKLKPDIAKFDFTVPLPSTPLFEEWQKKGYLHSFNWDNYGFYKGEDIYKHPNLSWELMHKYYNKAYRAFYLNPGYIAQQLARSIKNRTLTKDFKTFLKIRWH